MKAVGNRNHTDFIILEFKKFEYLNAIIAEHILFVARFEFCLEREELIPKNNFGN